MLESTSFKFHGPGEWDRLKHGEKRRSWRKSHIAIDAGTGEVLAHEVTDSNTSDAAMAGPLFANTGGRIRLVIADGAYNGEPVYEAIRSARPPRSSLKVVIRPHAPTIPPLGAARGGTERKRHASEIGAHGRMAWQKAHGDGRRSLVETVISRLKRRGGDRLAARTIEAQRKEIATPIAVANKAIRHAKPVSVRVD